MAACQDCKARLPLDAGGRDDLRIKTHKLSVHLEHGGGLESLLAAHAQRGAGGEDGMATFLDIFPARIHSAAGGRRLRFEASLCGWRPPPLCSNMGSTSECFECVLTAKKAAAMRALERERERERERELENSGRSPTESFQVLQVLSVGTN